MDVDFWLTIARLLAYAVLVPALTALAIDEHNGGRPRRGALFALAAIYYGIVLIVVTSEMFNPALSRLLRSALTPILLVQAAIAVWVWIRPQPLGDL